jgi:DNA polymerase II small subunit/DNA polymerase delta subunit B
MDIRFAKTLYHGQCLEYQEEYQNQLALTNRRLERLRATQKRDPSWKGYNPYADEDVSIDTYIEEQEAVKGEIEEFLGIIQDRLDDLTIKAKYPNSQKSGDNYQLSILDVVK